MIEAFQKIKQSGNGDLPVIHSFNAIYSVESEVIDGETFIVLKGKGNDN